MFEESFQSSITVNTGLGSRSYLLFVAAHMSYLFSYLDTPVNRNTLLLMLVKLKKALDYKRKQIELAEEVLAQAENCTDPRELSVSVLFSHPYTPDSSRLPLFRTGLR